MQKIRLKRLMASTPRELGFELVYKPLDARVGREAPEAFSEARERLWREVMGMAEDVRMPALDDTGAGDES
jgi:hypothetical protein